MSKRSNTRLGRDGKLHLNMFEPNRDGSPWYARVFRITTIRIISQAFFFTLFMY